jgi:anti-anti-sigma factor
MVLQQFEVESRAGARPGQRIVRLTGPLSLETVPEFLKALRAETAPAVILDLSGLSFLDSAGVGALIQTLVSLQYSGRKLAVVELSSQVLTVLEITRVHKLFTIFATVAQAEEQLG